MLTILFLVQAAVYFIDLSDYESLESDEFQGIQAKLDSLKNTESKSADYKIFPFNPNFISDFKGYQLGLNTDQIDRLFRYRNKGKFVNSSEEFQRVTGINDSLLHLIAPYFKFPKWSNRKSFKKKQNNIETFPREVQDLNKATIEELMSTNIIDYKMAKRIISYRNFLQGFSMNEQLYEVYYLKKETALKLMRFFKVMEIPQIKKINVNTASFKELLQLPYLDYTLTKRICQYRDENLYFKSLQELKKIDSFPMEKFDRIALYLLSE